MNDIQMDEDVAYTHKKGKQNLRLMILLFFMFLLIYSMVQTYIANELAQYTMLTFAPFYPIRIGIMLLIWIWSMVLLWRCSRLGKYVFVLSTILNLYFFIDIQQLLSVNMSSLQHQLMCLVYIILLISKNMLGGICAISLFRDRYIRSLWIQHLIDTKDITRQLATREELNERMQVKQVVRKKDTRLEDEAKMFLQRFAIVLLLYVSGCLFILYMCIFFIHYFAINNTLGMEYVQRTLSLSYLFSMLIWSTSAISMFFYKRSSKWLLYFMGIAEMLRVIWLFPSYVQVFQTQQYAITTPITLCILEAIRYIILFHIIGKIVTNPFINTFWKKKKNLSHREEL